MAEQDNYWDGSKWVDGATGNYMVPVDKGGDGIWYTADGQSKFVGGAWVPVSGGAGGTSGAYGSIPGYQWTVDELNRAHQAEQAALDRAANKSLQDSINQLQKELQAGTITDAQFRQAKDLAQRESEFARTLAFNQLQQQQDYELRQAQMEINKAAEIRQERETQARLAANPQDWVAYEFYKRSLGTPEGEETPAMTSPLTGKDYEAAPPAYSDEDIQSLAARLFTPEGAAYNPNLSGEGVFGTTIQSPNALSRREATSLSDVELGMLSGLLRGGIKMGDKRVSIDPTDYFRQSQESWIPTWRESQLQGTQYR